MGRGRDPLRRPRPEGSGPHLPRARAPASRERPPGASSMGRRPHRVRRGAARGQGRGPRRRLVRGAPRGGGLRGEPRRFEAGGGGSPPRARAGPPGGRPHGLAGPRVGVPGPRGALRQKRAPRPRGRHVHEGAGCPRCRRGVGGRRGRLGGAGPAPAGDPRRRPLEGGPRGGRPLLRPRRNEGEGGPTARAPRAKTGLNDSGRKAAAPSFTSLHPTFQMSRTPLDTRFTMALATIDLQQLWKSYDGQPALQGLFLQAYPGEIVGLIGPNGAGKTTSLKILVGLLRPDYGLVRVKGHDVLADPVGYKAELGYMPEAPTLPEYLTPTEFLGYVGRIRNLPRNRIAERTSELLRSLDLAPKADETIASLSKGMKAKVAFAAAILHEPSILVLDEPLIGIDPAGQHLLKERLVAMARAGATVLVSTHQLDTAERLCSRVAIVSHGRNVATGDLAALRAQAHTGAEGTRPPPLDSSPLHWRGSWRLGSCTPSARASRHTRPSSISS